MTLPKWAAVILVAIAYGTLTGRALAVEGGMTYAVPYGTPVTVMPNAVSTGPVQAGYTPLRLWSRVFNNGPPSAPTLWCSRFGAPVAGGGNASFPLAAAGSPDNINGWPWYEEFGTAIALPVPQLALQCTSAGSNTAGTAGTAAGSITVEYR